MLEESEGNVRLERCMFVRSCSVQRTAVLAVLAVVAAVCLCVCVCVLNRDVNKRLIEN